MTQFQPTPVSRGMTRSVFQAAVAAVFPQGLGETLCADQVLPPWGLTANQALAQGIEPLSVWQALLEESGRGSEENLWWHRREMPPA